MTIGGLERLSLTIDKPLPMKFVDMEINQINLLVGPNGVGKSFIMKVIWLLSFLINSIIKMGLVNHTLPQQALLEFCQFGLDNTLPETDASGMMMGFFKEGNIKIALEKGKVINVTTSDLQHITEATNVQYMSSAFRTFSAMSMYLSKRKDFADQPTAVIVNEMVKHFRLYDVLYMEAFIAKMPITVDKQLQSTFDSFQIREKITSFNFDEKEHDFYVYMDGREDKVWISRWFGSGHQALFNMILGSHQ